LKSYYCKLCHSVESGGVIIELEIDFTPRKWQSNALASWSVNMSGIAKVVTGGGKTTFAMLCIEQYFSIHQTGRCIVLVPSIALLDQWFVEFISDTNIDEQDISIYGGGSNPKEPNKINLLTLNTGRDVVSSIAREGDLLVVDECHRAAAPENSRAISIGLKLFTLGLSATPERQYDAGFEEILVPILGPIIIDYDYKQAHLDKVICDFELFNVRVIMNNDEITEYAALSRRIAISATNDGVESEKFLELCRTRARNIANIKLRIPTACKIVTENSDCKCIIFHESISAANDITKLLNGKNMYALAYHSGLNPAIRRDNLLKFKKGACNVLVTCRALDEGANIPEANLGIIAASTKSTRQRIQRLGRVLRTSKGKSAAKIYTIYATDDEMDKLNQESQDLEGISEVNWIEATTSN
jgi:superfamily II DNA or RNA helicase